MTKKQTKRQEPTIKITPRGERAPEHLLANAEMEFHTGLLAGVRLNGFALWRSTSDDGRRFISVTLPNRKVKDGSDVSYYDFLRGKRDDYDRIRNAVRARFREYAAEHGIEVPEDPEGTLPEAETK